MSKKIDTNLLLDAALELSEIHGYRQVTRDQIAALARVSTGAVTNGLGTMDQMRKTVVRHAVRTGRDRIIAQAITLGDPYVNRKLNPEDRIRVLQSVL